MNASSINSPIHQNMTTNTTEVTERDRGRLFRRCAIGVLMAAAAAFIALGAPAAGADTGAGTPNHATVSTPMQPHPTYAGNQPTYAGNTDPVPGTSYPTHNRHHSKS